MVWLTAETRRTELTRSETVRDMNTRAARTLQISTRMMAKGEHGMKHYPRPEQDDQPPFLYPPYGSTVRRAPTRPLIQLPHTLSELTGPLYGHNPIGESDNDLTVQHPGEPLGERIIVSGRVVDEDGSPIPHTLIELWQCNAAGRYFHSRDDHPAPLDPN